MVVLLDTMEAKMPLLETETPDGGRRLEGVIVGSDGQNPAQK
jgi:hypothetical protein